MQLRNTWALCLLGLIAVMFILACNGSTSAPVHESATLVPPPTATAVPPSVTGQPAPAPTAAPGPSAVVQSTPRPTVALGTSEETPYRREEVAFANGDIVLAGDLSLPAGDGPYPAVVLISGSGAQGRDANFLGFKTFAVIADHIARHGVAVLRFDDRGWGSSTGDALQATIPDRADDVKAAVEFLLALDDIDPELVGLIGYSEGGMIAPLVATQRDDIAFVVLMAAPAVTGEALLRAQLVEILKADGATQEQIEQAQAQQELVLRAVATGKGWDEVEAAVRETVRQRIEALSEASRNAIGDIDRYFDIIIQEQMKSAKSPWLRFFVEYDPVPALAGLTVPVLALYGELDTQVPVELNATAFSEIVTGAGNLDYTVATLAQANHLFQEALTGSISEYAELKPEFIPGFLESISEWILRQTGGP